MLVRLPQSHSLSHPLAGLLSALLLNFHSSRSLVSFKSLPMTMSLFFHTSCDPQGSPRFSTSQHPSLGFQITTLSRYSRLPGRAILVLTLLTTTARSDVSGSRIHDTSFFTHPDAPNSYSSLTFSGPVESRSSLSRYWCAHQEAILKLTLSRSIS